jgi:predicted PurR-regulated permease PerM
MNENKGKMDEKTNSTVNKRAALVFAVIIGLMLLISQMEPIMNVVEKIMDMMFPVLLGVVLAYVVNPFTTFIERRLYKWFKFKREKTHRRFAKGMAVVLSLFALLLTITLLIFLIIPEFLDNLNRLLESAPAFIERISGWIEDIQSDNSVLMQNLGQYIDTAISSLVDWLSGEVGGAVSGALGVLVSGVRSLSSAIGLIGSAAILSAVALPLVTLFGYKISLGACSIICSFSGSSHGQRLFSSLSAATDAMLAALTLSATLYILELSVLTSVIKGVL